MTPDTQPRSQPRPSQRRRAALLTSRVASRPRMPPTIDAARRPRAASVAPVVDTTLANHLPQLLLAIAFVAAIALLSFPAARAPTITLGWMPLWLVGMPLVSVAALRLGKRW